MGGLTPSFDEAGQARVCFDLLVEMRAAMLSGTRAVRRVTDHGALPP